MLVTALAGCLINTELYERSSAAASLNISASLLRSTGPPTRPRGGDDQGVYASA